MKYICVKDITFKSHPNDNVVKTGDLVECEGNIIGFDSDIVIALDPEKCPSGYDHLETSHAMIDAKAFKEHFQLAEENGSSNWGYMSTKDCAICGKYNENQSEPRFGYTVCIKHQHARPTDIKRGKK
jgi:hypothetical protein